jgi:ribosomal protein S18 acetylase RimI-like enzyme
VTPEPFEIRVDEAPDAEDIRQLVAGLVAYNRGRTGSEDRQPIAAFVRSGTRVVGGADGYTHWGWLYVSHLWVGDDLRGQGVGRRVMETLEDAARARGCRAAWLDTFSFQAPEFYRRLGYRVFGELDDFPEGYRRHYLWKPLTTSR